MGSFTTRLFSGSSLPTGRPTDCVARDQATLQLQLIPNRRRHRKVAMPQSGNILLQRFEQPQLLGIGSEATRLRSQRFDISARILYPLQQVAQFSRASPSGMGLGANRQRRHFPRLRFRSAKMIQIEKPIPVHHIGEIGSYPSDGTPRYVSAGGDDPSGHASWPGDALCPLTVGYSSAGPATAHQYPLDNRPSPAGARWFRPYSRRRRTNP